MDGLKIIFEAKLALQKHYSRDMKIDKKYKIKIERLIQSTAFSGSSLKPNYEIQIPRIKLYLTDCENNIINIIKLIDKIYNI
jgi:hypothetical protein